jgi:hypothetical protein
VLLKYSTANTILDKTIVHIVQTMNSQEYDEARKGRSEAEEVAVLAFKKKRGMLAELKQVLIILMRVNRFHSIL